MVVYADDSFTNTLLYKSTDAGETWTPAADPEGSESLGVLYLGNNLRVQ